MSGFPLAFFKKGILVVHPEFLIEKGGKYFGTLYQNITWHHSECHFFNRPKVFSYTTLYPFQRTFYRLLG
jgi:hypothetical protein